MSKIPTRVRRWLTTDDGRQYVIVPRATLRALIKVYDWTRARLSEVSWPYLVDVAATSDDIERELDGIRRLLDAPGDE